VTFFDFHGDQVNPRMRATLAPGIPVLERNYWFPGVVEAAERFGFELVHTHHGSVDEFFGVASGLETRRLAHVVTTHGMYEAMPREIFLATWGKVRASVDAWVYIADKNLVPFREEGIDLGDMCVKIPNGMRIPDPHPPPRSSLGIADDAFVVCLASRAIPEKGWRVAVKIVEESRRVSVVDIQLLLLGDGPVYEEMQNETLPEFVHLLGFVSQVVDYFAMSDVGILPTTFEGESFPLSIIECLMAGRPVIASDVGEVREMLSADEGRVAGFLIDVDGGSVPLRETVEQLVELATNREVYDVKRRLAKEVAPRFDMDRVVDRYAEVYRRALAQK